MRDPLLASGGILATVRQQRIGKITTPGSGFTAGLALIGCVRVVDLARFV